jgi:hypothetical protein
MVDNDTDASGKRRRPTTIDLTATEIASAPATPSEPVGNTAETARVETPPGPDAAPESTPESGRAAPPEWLGTATWNERLSAMRRNVAARFDWRSLGAGVTGAAAMFVLFLAAYAGGAFAPRDDATALLNARLAGLEKQVRDLDRRPQPAAPDPRRIADLTARVAAAEQAIGKLEAAPSAPRAAQADPALAGRVAALETALRPLTDAPARIDSASASARDAKARADAAYEAAQKSAQEAARGASAAPSQKEIDDLAGRVATLEQATKAVEARVAATAGADKAGRLAFTAAALRATVVRGEPFVQELGAVRPLLADAKVLGALEPFATTGVPSATALARELSALSGAMLAAAGASPPREGSFMDRLQQNAERLVRIRPISEAAGDDPATVIGRAEVKATQGDLAGARADIASLLPAVQAPAQRWIARVDARNAALAAARDLAENAIGTLAKP